MGLWDKVVNSYKESFNQLADMGKAVVHWIGDPVMTTAKDLGKTQQTTLLFHRIFRKEGVLKDLDSLSTFHI